MKNTILKFVILLGIFLFSAISYGQNNMIPNTLNCSSTRPPFSFDIQHAWANPPTGISNFSTPICGDLDGDGKIEILVMSSSGQSVLIFDGKTGVKVGDIETGTTSMSSNYNLNPYAICDVDGDGKAEILIANLPKNKATLYELKSSTGVTPLVYEERWSVSLPQLNAYSKNGTLPFVADLDGDGKPEFIVAQYIINYKGDLKATLAYTGQTVVSERISTPLAVDLDKDGIPEVVVGTYVYKYNGSGVTLWRYLPDYTSTGQDGSNMAADINLDGDVDLVYSDTHLSGNGKITVWTPSTNNVIGSFTAPSTNFRSYPVVGNLNGDAHPEICFNANNHLYAYKYNGGSSFTQLWDLPTNENSGIASFTFFDFNYDGFVELVYRDEKKLHIYECKSGTPIEVFSMDATSGTVVETPIVADVTGDGSANIIVTGSNKLFVFEGMGSKWASCPSVWNQQLYNPLLINTDLTVISNVESPAWNGQDSNGKYPRFYNGGPMQVPYISKETFLPFDLAPDPFIISGDITISGTNATIKIVVGNQGLVPTPANLPIRFYKNAIAPANILSSANTTLGTELAVGQTITITKTISGLNPMPTQFYVRILDDGINFPAIGAFSDCNLSNNSKSFGTLELKKVANSLSACVDGSSIFTVELINNSGLASTPVTYNNIALTDSLGDKWQFVSATSDVGVVGPYNSGTGKMAWDIGLLPPGDTAKLIVVAKAMDAGSNRNTVWVDKVNGVSIGREAIEAYVIVQSEHAPAATSISPTNPQLCNGQSVLLTALVNAGSYQWYKNNIEITGATQKTYVATTSGNYSVTYFNGTCVSQMSDAVTIGTNCILARPDTVWTTVNDPIVIDVLSNDLFPGCTTDNIEISLSTQLVAQLGNVTIVNNKLSYTPDYNKYGIDSVRYILKDCNSMNKDSTTIYIAVLKSLSNQYIACSGATVTLGMEAVNKVQYYWYTTLTGGTTGGPSNTITVTKSASSLQTWYVEVKYDNRITFKPRFAIDLSISDNCGTTIPTGCSSTGTLLFREDFGGNNLSDLRVSTTPLSSGITDYNFSPINNHSAINTYWLLKYNTHTAANNVWHTDFSDHTYPQNRDIGYMFMVDASATPSKFYEYTISGLCANSKLYFSAWLANLLKSGAANPDDPNLKFELLDSDDQILAEYYTGTLPRDPNGNFKWRLYGFEFNLPDGQASVKLKIYNNAAGSNGNDFVMDDIEIRLCVPEVSATISKNQICKGGNISLVGSYTDDGSFGNKLVGYWQWSLKGDVNTPSEWTNILPKVSSNTGVISSNITLIPIDHETAYYRFIVSNEESIHKPYCHASSEVLLLKIKETISKYPDLRIQTCMGVPVYLNSYIDTVDFVKIEWSKHISSAPNVGISTGIVNGFFKRGMYIYTYKIENTCNKGVAMAYVNVLENFVPTTRLVAVCRKIPETARVNLNQILGVEAGGSITSLTTGGAYLKHVIAPSKFEAAYFFDAKSAWEDNAYIYITHNGDSQSKKFEFEYTPPPGSCIGNNPVKLTVIVTSSLIP